MKKENWFRKTVVDLESPLLTYTMKLLQRLAPSEEVVQESFLKLWKQQYPGDFEHYPKAWLYRVCRNHAIDILRKDQKISNEENVEEILSTPCLSESLMQASQIMQEIRKLEPLEQEVLVLKFNDDLTYKEIAELTGLSVSHVGVKIHHGLQKIKEVLLKELNQLDPQAKGDRHVN